MGAGWQKFDVDIPENISAFDRKVMAEEIIEYIRKRTENSKDKYGINFTKYSSEYMDSLDFKIAGKTSKVNLKQTGDMLAAIQLLSDKKGKLTIGFEKGTLENDKADGHITGNIGVKRDFLGFSGSEENKKLKNIISKYKERSSKAIEQSLLWASVENIRMTKRPKPMPVEFDEFEEFD